MHRFFAISRLIVEGDRPKARAISRIDSSRSIAAWIHSRSSIDKRRYVAGLRLGNCFTPPASRNHRRAVVTGTPTREAASSTEQPAAMHSHNPRRAAIK
ncbi:hypothetical protein Pve01_90450 [Planomonospora venezuelensis]|nr:hypothetical protein Pve01_90450 [Planomonospora venezuelensis]